MYTSLLTKLALFVVSGTLLASSAAQAQTVLRYNQWVPVGHHSQSKIMKPWFEAIEKATDGRVKIEPTTSSLGAPPTQFDLARDGVADVVFAVHSYTPARFTLGLIGLLPFTGDSAEAVSVAYWRVTKKMFEQADEYKGIKLLGLMTSDPGHLFNARRPVASVEDFKGLKLRVATTVTAKIVEVVGAVPVTAPAPKTYEILANGVADGTFSTLDAFRSWKLQTLQPYFTRFPGGLYNNTFYIAMNLDKWNAISPEDQAAIERVSGEAFAVMAGRQWDAEAKAGEALMAESNTKITQADGEFLTKMRDTLAFIEKEWVESAKAKGVDGSAALAMMRSEAAAYSKSKGN